MTLTLTFAFDPASNLLDPQAPQGLADSSSQVKINGIPAILNNLLKDYAGTHFDYDARGNMVKRIHNSQVTNFRWSAGNQLLEVTEPHLKTTRYYYDPLGRRIAKHSAPLTNSIGTEEAPEQGLWGSTLFGWDGDQMAWEADYARRLTVHYVFEPNSFVPLLQASSQSDIRKLFLKRPKQFVTEYTDEDGGYDLDRDPLYNGEYEPGLNEAGNAQAPLENIHYYQCDHLGTPMELTDDSGNIAWEANYKAWGEAKITISEAARKAKLKNPIRFQGQYFDEESGLHYNRYRYYDPVVGRFISKDPISLSGGINFHQYASNPVSWADPFGLAANAGSAANRVRGASAASGPNTIAVINHPGGAVTVGVNQGGQINDQVSGELKNIPPKDFGGQCAEVNAIARALSKGRQLEGATISIVDVRGKNSRSGIHGKPKPPCSVCGSLINKFGLRNEH